MTEPPDGARPRGTLPLGPGPFPPPTAPRDARVTPPGGVRGGGYLAPELDLPELLEDAWEDIELDSDPELVAVEPGREAVAPPAPFSRAPVQSRGAWARPSPGRLTSARLLDSLALRVATVALAAIAILTLAVMLGIQQRRLELPELPAGSVSAAPIASEPGPAAEPVPSAASAPTATARPASATDARRPAARQRGALDVTSSDVVYPWRNR